MTMESFDGWLRDVDRAIARLAGGLVSDDLPDQPYYEWFAENVTPNEAARFALEDAGFMVQ